MAAAKTFAQELEAYSSLSEQFLQVPLTGSKELEQINALLEKIGGTEGRLQTAGQELASTASAALQEQQRLAQAMVQHLPRVKERQQLWQGFVQEFTELGKEALSLKDRIAAGGELQQKSQAGDLQPLLDALHALADRSAGVAERAQQADFAELRQEADSLREKLMAAASKLPAPTPAAEA